MGNFTSYKTPISGLIVIEPKVYGDNRGFFMESYSKRDFEEVGITVEFVQDNHSKSSKNVLRGIHMQKEHPQGKLVRVVSGSVYDVAVDLRKYSPTLGQWYGVKLSSENKKMLYIPPGFGHGFLTLEDGTEFLYKTTEYYHPEDEVGIKYDDLDLAIDWGIEYNAAILSKKDRSLMTYVEYIRNV